MKKILVIILAGLVTMGAGCRQEVSVKTSEEVKQPVAEVENNDDPLGLFDGSPPSTSTEEDPLGLFTE